LIDCIGTGRRGSDTGKTRRVARAGLCSLWHLVHSNGVYRPVRLRKVGWIVSNKVNARIQAIGACVLGTIRERLIYLPSPSAAEVRIDDNAHVSEMSIDVASALMIHGWRSKLRCIRSAIGNTRWDISAAEEPSLEITRCPFSDIDSSSIAVKALSVVVRCSRIAHQ
jgi:hypothetical protein